MIYQASPRWSWVAMWLVGTSACPGEVVRPPENDAAIRDAGPPPTDAALRFDAAVGELPPLDGGGEVWIDEISPRSGVIMGGYRVRITGSGFNSDTAVYFGDQAGDNVLLQRGTSLTVRVPPASESGPVDVSVDNGAHRATVPGGFTYFDGISLSQVAPRDILTRGGDTVSITGDGFVGEVLVLIGGRAVAELRLIDSTQVQVVTPPGTAGLVDLEVLSAFGRAELPLALRYVEPPAPRIGELRLDAVEPAAGLASGGTVVTVRGEAFTSDTVVHFGGRPLQFPTWVSAQIIGGVTPPGSAGQVDVAASDPGNGEGVLEGGFTYVAELQLLGVRPERGSVAGGTYAVLFGTGFTAASELSVSFGGRPAGAVEILSDNTASLRTPAHAAGVVSVAVAQGDEAAEVERGYSYYDPGFLMGGTRGEAVEGTVNVTCFDGITGFPLEGITVQLGTSPETPYVALTNADGQATLSGPDLRGPQTVSAAAAGYESVSLIGVDATDISLFLNPTTMTPSTGQPPPLPPPPSISGRVYGFAKELFDPAAMGPGRSAMALVETTIRTVFSSPSYPQASQYVVAEGGSYLIPSSRPGRLAVVAVAGIYDSADQSFRPRQLGFRRGVNAAYGDELVDVDVELTVPLNSDLVVHLPDIPYRDPEPATSVVMSFLNLGGEGVYPLADVWQPGASSFTFSDFPDMPGELLTFLAGAFTVSLDAYGGASLGSPYSVVVRDGVGNLSSGLTLDPILGFPELIEPLPNGVMQGNVMRWKAAPGTPPSYYDIYLAGFDGTLWNLLVPGTLNKVVVPIFPELNAELPPQNIGTTAMQGWISAVYVPGFSFDNFSYLDLSALARRAWTDDSFKFVHPAPPVD